MDGVLCCCASFDFRQIMAHKDAVSKQLSGGVRGLLKMAGVSVVMGSAAFADAKTLEISLPDGGTERLTADAFVIATDAVNAVPPIPGLTEKQAKEMGLHYKVGKFPLMANGRALILNGGEGLIKVILGEPFGEVLGVHIIGPRASDLIAEAALAIRLEATADEIISTIHGHPTVSEALREAFLAADHRTLHMPN